MSERKTASEGKRTCIPAVKRQVAGRGHRRQERCGALGPRPALRVLQTRPTHPAPAERVTEAAKAKGGQGVQGWQHPRCSEGPRLRRSRAAAILHIPLRRDKTSELVSDRWLCFRGLHRDSSVGLLRGGLTFTKHFHIHFFNSL